MFKSFLSTNLIVFLGCVLVPWNMIAKSYDTAQLPIVVRNMPEWSNEYLTVINNWEGQFVNSVNGELPPLLSVVTSINGREAKGMNEEEFNNLLISQNRCTIEYLTKKNGVNEKKQCTISYCPSIYWAEGITMYKPEDFPENITLKNIKNASVFSFNTFSYKIGGMEELDEQEVLEAVGIAFEKLGYKKTNDSKNADMLLELAKERDDFNGYGIVLNVFDGRKKRDGIERVLWSLHLSSLSRNLKQQESIIKTSLKKMCSNFPFDMPMYSQGMNMLGIAFENEQAVLTGKTLKVLKGSNAYEKGLRSGDAIVGAYAGYSCDHVLYTRTRRYYFKPNKADRRKNWGVDLFIILPIIPQFTYNNASHYLIDDKWRGGQSSQNHFRIRNNYGDTFSIYAPFEKKDINFKYIP